MSDQLKGVSAVFGILIQCVWCETFVGMGRGLNRQVVEEYFVGHGARGVGSGNLKMDTAAYMSFHVSDDIPDDESVSVEEVIICIGVWINSFRIKASGSPWN